MSSFFSKHFVEHVSCMPGMRA
ncbi:hypothetical protein M8C21_022851 [Ambrosia artemisiifolia]|uniref:Uncharacterized protein n=1 Tax=Ambrosia artemisiifolia TaxID=4212 RepID=A0AAD5DCZ9_AMBAR|nr:hypothetical protein M8C21_022851 [Ambrosia artemisiifolia]